MSNLLKFKKQQKETQKLIKEQISDKAIQDHIEKGKNLLESIAENYGREILSDKIAEWLKEKDESAPGEPCLFIRKDEAEKWLGKKEGFFE